MTKVVEGFVLGDIGYRSSRQNGAGFNTIQHGFVGPLWNGGVLFVQTRSKDDVLHTQRIEIPAGSSVGIVIDAANAPADKV